MNSENKKHIAILGSTGSIGTQTLEVVAANAHLFKVEVLTAHSNAELLASQAIAFDVNAVVITDESKYAWLKEKLAHTDIKVFAGEQALSEVVTFEKIQLVLTALVGYAGLKPTIAAIKAKKNIALANKETLVVAGDLITKLAEEYDLSFLGQIPLVQSIREGGDEGIPAMVGNDEISKQAFRNITAQAVRNIAIRNAAAPATQTIKTQA